MATSIKNNTNLYVINSINGLVKKRYPVYESGEIFLYAPAIQSNESNSNREGVDISNDNMFKLFDEKKTTLLIVRYFEGFLIIEGKELYEKLKGVTRKNKWAFKVERKGSLADLYLSDYGFITKLKIYDKQEFIHHLQNAYHLSFDEQKLNENKKDEQEIQEVISIEPVDLLNQISTFIKSKGFLYSDENIKNLYLSLRSKPFVILSGISGTGKTKIVELFAEAVGANSKNGRFKLIPVRPDWSDGSDLIGYTDVKEDFNKGPLTEIIIKAASNPQYPHFVVLDEMNLARVEYYLSDFLSIIESRGWKGDAIETDPIVEFIDEDGKQQKYHIPENLYIIGTVNMDETTHPFSKKVLDRANSIEFNEVHLTSFSMFSAGREDVQPVQVSNDLFKSNYLFLRDVYKGHEELIQNVSKELEEINEMLKDIYAQVGYRVRDEIAFYLAYNEELELLDRDEAMDFCMMQKILPRISGAGRPVEKLLESLFEKFSSKPYSKEMDLDSLAPYPRSSRKLYEMIERLRVQGFVSFWGA